jgi:hypothetical protein
MRYLARILTVLLIAAIVAPFETRAQAFEAGFIELTLKDPVEGGPMQAIVMYPTRAPAGTTRVGLLTLAAVRDAVPCENTTSG